MGKLCPFAEIVGRVQTRSSLNKPGAEKDVEEGIVSNIELPGPGRVPELLLLVKLAATLYADIELERSRDPIALFITAVLEAGFVLRSWLVTASERSKPFGEFPAELPLLHVLKGA